MTNQYNGKPPVNLIETLESIVLRMTEIKLIVLSEKAINLPYYISMPMSTGYRSSKRRIKKR